MKDDFKKYALSMGVSSSVLNDYRKAYDYINPYVI